MIKMPRAPEAPDWSQQPCLRIGKALLGAPGRTLTAGQIGGSNVGRTAAKLVAAEMLEERPPPHVPLHVGRRSTKAFHLPAAQVDAVKAQIAAEVPVGDVRPGQQLVTADAGGNSLARLLEALDVSEALAEAAWFVLSDGDPQQFIVAFSGDAALRNAQNLVAELQGAGLLARRASVGQVGTANDLAAQARSSAAASRKARMRTAS
jgi:hypothetical protein